MAFCELGTTCHDFVCICQCRYSKQCDWRFCYIVVLTGWEVSNRYVVKNSVGQQVFFAAEESDVCTRQCCGNARGFVMHITDNLGQVRLSYLLIVSPESGFVNLWLNQLQNKAFSGKTNSATNKSRCLLLNTSTKPEPLIIWHEAHNSSINCTDNHSNHYQSTGQLASRKPWLCVG